MSLKLLILINFVAFSASLECGKVKVGTSFVAGGAESGKGQWPWLAPLFNKNTSKFFCGSSIISKQHLLGAAHCLQDKFISPTPASNVYALIGRWNLKEENELGSVKVDIAQTVINPDWKPRHPAYDGDIAILFLSREITYSAYVQPICLPSTDVDVFNVKGSVAGYGYREGGMVAETIPRHVEISSVDHGTCLYSEERLAKIGSLRMFCAGEVGKNPCQGDSGGGKNQKWEIYGIVSASVSPECGENQFVLFTNVVKYIGWINKVAVNVIVPTQESYAQNSTEIATRERHCNEGLIAGECMRLGDVIYSCHNCFLINFFYDGNLAVYTMKEPITAIWSAQTPDLGGVKVCMQSDGNLVMSTAQNKTVWSTKTSNNPGAYAVMQYDGQLAIWKDGQRKYASGKLAQCDRKPSKLPEYVVLGKNRACNEGLVGGECMKLGDVVYSCHKCFKLSLLYDGNLVVFTTTDPRTAIWGRRMEGTGITKACMQTDGNFVLFTSNGTAMWSSGTQNNPGAHAEMKSDGRFAIVKDGEIIWHSELTAECRTPSNE